MKGLTMASYNRVVLVGNLTREVDFKAISADFAVGNFSLAVNEKRKDKDGNWIDEASFIDCKAFGRTAEVLRDYTGKGSCVLVEGRLRQETWEQDGQKRSKIVVVVDRLNLMDKKSDNGGQSDSSKPSQARQTAQRGKKQAQQQSYDYDAGSGEDIPF